MIDPAARTVKFLFPDIEDGRLVAVHSHLAKVECAKPSVQASSMTIEQAKSLALEE